MLGKKGMMQELIILVIILIALALIFLVINSWKL